MLKELHQRIIDHTAKIGVIGLGYVGLPVACMMAKSGFQTVGIDLDEMRVATINASDNPIKGIEPGLASLIAEVVNAQTLKCSTSYNDLSLCDVVLISVQTPIEETDHRPLYKHLQAALSSLGEVLKKGALVIIESTLAPGTMHNIVIPTLERATGESVDSGFYAGHCPERVTPGRLIRNLTSMSRAVGGSNPDVATIMATLYSNYVTGDLDETDLLTAELVKTAENAYRDVQIAFANELARICHSVGGDVWQVRELVNKSPGRNVLLPGAGVGGHCIPKDPWLLIANVKDSPTHLIPAARLVNRDMSSHVKQLLVDALAQHEIAVQDAKIAVLGYAYMENSDDTRDTPTQAFIDLIQGEVADIRIHDPFVDPYQLDIAEIVAGTDAIVLMVKHTHYYEQDWSQHAAKMRTPIIVDTRHILPDDFELSAGSVHVLGIGG